MPTLAQLNEIYVFVDLVPTKIGEDLSGIPGVTPSITIAENKITSTETSFYNITENNYASASSDSKELLIKDGWKIKSVEYPYIVGDGGTLYNIGDSFNATGTGNGLYITLEQSGGGSTLTFKHFYDAGTIGTGTIKFRHYSQQEPSSGETWVLNETVSFDLSTVHVDFISNNENFKSIEASSSSKFEKYLTYTKVNGDAVIAFQETTETYWSNTAYRTITFSEPVTDSTLLAWLQANGVKQGTVTGHTLTFGSELTVTVDGVSVTSPYTLTKNCTIVAATTNGSDLGGTPPKMTVNDVAYGDDTTIALSGTDISVINANQGEGQQFPWSNITVTINYSE